MFAFLRVCGWAKKSSAWLDFGWKVFSHRRSNLVTAGARWGGAAGIGANFAATYHIHNRPNLPSVNIQHRVKIARGAGGKKIWKILKTILRKSTEILWEQDVVGVQRHWAFLLKLQLGRMAAGHKTGQGQGYITYCDTQFLEGGDKKQEAVPCKKKHGGQRLVGLEICLYKLQNMKECDWTYFSAPCKSWNYEVIHSGVAIITSINLREDIFP